MDGLFWKTSGTNQFQLSQVELLEICFLLYKWCKTWPQSYIWVFPKMVVPNNHGFPTRNDHFGVFWEYHHLRKHSFLCYKPKNTNLDLIIWFSGSFMWNLSESDSLLFVGPTSDGKKLETGGSCNLSYLGHRWKGPGKRPSNNEACINVPYKKGVSTRKGTSNVMSIDISLYQDRPFLSFWFRQSHPHQPSGSFVSFRNYRVMISLLGWQQFCPGFGGVWYLKLYLEPKWPLWLERAETFCRVQPPGNKGQTVRFQVYLYICIKQVLRYIYMYIYIKTQTGSKLFYLHIYIYIHTHIYISPNLATGRVLSPFSLVKKMCFSVGSFFFSQKI